eukprot:9107146-Prorocentrum_lima.AAC.1
MTSSLVGSEMCIRDRCVSLFLPHGQVPKLIAWRVYVGAYCDVRGAHSLICLLYTSDAADDM